jgi:hypothetical protein
VRIAQRKAKRLARRLLLPNFMPFSFFKEQLGRYRSYILKMCQPNFVRTYFAIKTAA